MPGVYVDPEVLKDSRNLKGTTFVDDDLETAAVTASRVVDGLCDRTFDVFDESNDQATARYFTAQRPSTVEIDDCVEVTGVAVDWSGGDDYSDVWDDSDYRVGPTGAALRDRPYERIRVRGSLARPWGRWCFPAGVVEGVKVTAKWGWVALPEAVVDATSLLAIKIVKWKREAPLGVVINQDVGFRLANSDLRMATLLDDYMRKTVIV